MHCMYKCLLLGLVCHPVSIKVMLDVHIVGVCLGEQKVKTLLFIKSFVILIIKFKIMQSGLLV